MEPITNTAISQVEIHGVSWGALGSWATFLAVIGGIGTLIKAIGPARILELLFNRDKELRGEKALEEASIGQRVSGLEDRLARMGQAVTFLMNASTSTLSALEAENKDNPAIARGRELVALAASALGNEDPFSKALGRLANVRGVGE